MRIPTLALLALLALSRTGHAGPYVQSCAGSPPELPNGSAITLKGAWLHLGGWAQANLVPFATIDIPPVGFYRVTSIRWIQPLGLVSTKLELEALEEGTPGSKERYRRYYPEKLALIDEAPEAPLPHPVTLHLPDTYPLGGMGIELQCAR
jgi:hypothetical protein